MHVPELEVSFWPFSQDELEAWKGRERSLIADCWGPLRRVLCKKADARPGRRFFGEAYVAAGTPCEQAWYGSFKWLTSPRWSQTHRRLKDPYQRRFRAALLRHFPELEQAQEVARAVRHLFPGPKPVGPDLWFVSDNRHRFVEVKLPDDDLKRHQLVGLALIALYLHSDRPVSVEVVSLYCGGKRDNSKTVKKDFSAVCAKLEKAASGLLAPRTGRRETLR